jgi:hypothetical protein
MLIPMRQPHPSGSEARSPLISSERRTITSLIRIEQRFVRLKRVAVSCTRLIAILLGVLAFRWSIFMPVHTATLALAIALGCVALALGYAHPYTGWPMLALDSLIIFLLLYGTGGSNSPLLGLTLLPMLIGGLLGNSNGVLAGTGTGVTIFLIVNLTHRHPLNALVFDLVLLQVACGLAISWLWRGADALLATLRDDLHTQRETKYDSEQRRPPIRLIELNHQIDECSTLDQLVHLTIDRAAAITGASAQVELTNGRHTDRSENGNPRALCVVIPSEEITGTITIHLGPGDLSLAQRDAIDYLAYIVGLRAAVLRRSAWQQRQQAAVTALWEISGLLRIASTGEECVRDGLTRLADALDLDWLALLAPNQFSALAPFMIARGRAGRGVPTISGAQLRVAAEALRGERPLIRMEGASSLACLPIGLIGQAPIVISAYGHTDDASTQALLMLFGNLIMERLAADANAGANEPVREQLLAA